MSDVIDARLARLAAQPFRAKFHLRAHERGYVALRSMTEVSAHALDLLGTRVAPAAPRNDGRQTPYRGHPVFVAQHATATCCRSCLEKWHGIAKGRALTDEELRYAVDVVCRWIERECAQTRSSYSIQTDRSAPVRS